MKYGLIFLLIGVVVIVVSAKRGKAYKAKLESLQAREYVLFEERERLRSEWEKIYEIKKVISDLEKKTEKELLISLYLHIIDIEERLSSFQGGTHDFVSESQIRGIVENAISEINRDLSDRIEEVKNSIEQDMLWKLSDLADKLDELSAQ